MGPFPEHLLRKIWQEQTFARAHLRTSDGKPVTILSAGMFNADGGPDYLDARVRIGNITYRGDIELHSDSAEWHTHSHDSDPHYNRVILHVVMTTNDLAAPARTATRRAIPLLVLHPYLDESARTVWMKSVSDERGERLQAIKCRDRNDSIPTDVIASWISSLAAERLELKVRRFEERLKQLVDERRSIIREPYPRYYGNPDEIPPPKKEYTQRDFINKRIWEQLLFEGIMEGMGYSKNREPFLALAQSMQLNILRVHGLTDSQTMMSLLFGAAGLLPSTRILKEKETRAYVRQLRGMWKGARRTFRGTVLHEADWLFFRLRPSNFPTARLAAMCFLLPSLFGEQAFRRLISIFKAETTSAREQGQSLRALFTFKPDDYWNHHYHFKGVAGRSGITIGPDRVNDILINAVLPTVLLYARIFKDHSVRTNARATLATLVPSQNNSITRMMSEQLFKNKIRIASALQQQGAIQLYKFYCSQDRCLECKIGQKVFR